MRRHNDYLNVCVKHSSRRPLYYLQYVVSYLQHNYDHSEPRIANYAKWCLRHLRRSRSHARRMPPSRAEITVS